MDLISFGFYNQKDLQKFNKIIDKYNSLEVLYNFKQFEIEDVKALDVLKDFYGIFSFASLICVETKGTPYYSGILIEEMENYYFSNLWGKNEDNSPLFFNLIDDMILNKLKDFVLVFSAEFNKKMIVRQEEIKIEELKNRLYRLYVWQEHYFDILNKTHISEDYYPLILEVRSEFKR